MKLEEMYLTKEELPILHKTGFEIPIHPKLLNPNLKINPEIAHNIFPEVAQDWHNDLKQYVNQENAKDVEWIQEQFINKTPKIEIKYNNQVLNPTGWEDDISVMENGLVNGLSISRNYGGSLYFYKDDINCERLIPSPYNKFSKDKVKEFSSKEIGKYSKAFTYSSHNIDNYPGALFLRNWAIKYMNEVFKEVFS